MYNYRFTPEQLKQLKKFQVHQRQIQQRQALINEYNELLKINSANSAKVKAKILDGSVTRYELYAESTNRFINSMIIVHPIVRERLKYAVSFFCKVSTKTPKLERGFIWKLMIENKKPSFDK